VQRTVITKMRQSIELWVTRYVFTGSMLCSIALCLVLALRRSRLYTAMFFCLIGVVCLCWFLIGYLFRKRRSVGWFLTAAVLNLCIVVPELALRTAQFRYGAGIQFGWPRPVHWMSLVPDKDLFWRLPPGAPNVNSMGFPGDEVAVPKPPGVYRMLYLGDSCTQMGYPDIVERLLNSAHAGRPIQFESVTLAIAGYSSYQGRVLANLYGSTLEPDLVVVYFGWNDHWRAYGSIDSERAEQRWSQIMAFVYRKSRIMQAAKKLSKSVGSDSADMAFDEVRVPPDQYKDNLLEIYRVFDRANVPVIYITAPTSHYRLGVPDYLVKERFVPDKQSAVTLHRQYNRIVKNLTRETGAYLLDLEFEFDGSPNLTELFEHDGIHFTPLGLDVVAGRISEFIQTTVLLADENPSTGLPSP